MTNTELIQFQNKNNKTLRGIFVSKEGNKKIVVMVSGFERKATTEKKFKALSDGLVSKGVDCFRFDWEGLGLSDGDFSEFTVERLKKDLFLALKEIRDRKDYESISLVSHSVSGCVAGLARKEINWSKILLLGPALNQKALLRYYFVKNKIKKQDPGLEIDWHNFKDYLEEEEFKQSFKEGKLSKENYISADYFRENAEKDYSLYFEDAENVLLIQGDSDDKVPLESLGVDFPHKIIVKKGDHDLERPDMIIQWLPETLNFLT